MHSPTGRVTCVLHSPVYIANRQITPFPLSDQARYFPIKHDKTKLTTMQFFSSPRCISTCSLTRTAELPYSWQRPPATRGQVFAPFMVTSPSRSSCGAWNGPAFRRFAKKPIRISNIQIFVPVNLGPLSRVFCLRQVSHPPTIRALQTAAKKQKRQKRLAVNSMASSIRQLTIWHFSLGFNA